MEFILGSLIPTWGQKWIGGQISNLRFFIELGFHSTKIYNLLKQELLEKEVNPVLEKLKGKGYYRKP